MNILIVGDKMNKKKIWYIVISILIPLVIGFVGSMLGGSMDLFNNIEKPSFAPPAILFPIVWGVLYVLMGISSYLVYISDSEYKNIGLIFYAIQLILNSLWTMIFFRFEKFLLAFIWLVLITVFVIIMMYYFYKSDKKAFYLQIPYLIWLIFATILNYSIYTLN